MRAFFAASLIAMSAAAAQQTKVIQVGEDTTGKIGFLFTPANVTAANGDTVMFNFSGNPGMHSVAQSSFNSPCQGLSGGFDSGFVFISGSPTVTPTWNLTITNQSQPIWFYCKQLAPQPHCTAGMVGAINAPTNGTNTFDAFETMAHSAPGTPGQAEGGLVGIGASASAPPGPFSGSISGSGNPTMAGPAATGSASASGSGSGSASGSAASTSPTSNAAASVVANGLVLLISALTGIALA